jgi:hypothetical protein
MKDHFVLTDTRHTRSVQFSIVKDLRYRDPSAKAELADIYALSTDNDKKSTSSVCKALSE